MGNLYHTLNKKSIKKFLNQNKLCTNRLQFYCYTYPAVWSPKWHSIQNLHEKDNNFKIQSMPSKYICHAIMSKYK